MAEETFEEKTEPASERKRTEARKKGKVLKSVELNSAFVIVFGLLLLYFSGAAIATELSAVARNMFSIAGTFEVNMANLHELLTNSFMHIGLTIAPLVIGLMIVGVVANVAQVGFVISTEAMMPSAAKLNPLTGLRKIMISRRSMVELLKNALKILIVGVTGYYALNGISADALQLMDSDAAAVLGFIAASSLSVGLKTGLAFLVLAVADYFYQRFEFERDLKMTRQEVKEELRTMEGDPTVKGKVKEIQRRIAYRRMMHEVPKASVVITNPTHFAVALRYDAGKMDAPRLVAKGADRLAQRIKEIALEHNIPVVEDKPLARALYKSVEIGHVIPEKLFQSVAQVLAYIYKMKRTRPFASVY
jgi:flagellar biosynthesis protein FlhB